MRLNVFRQLFDSEFGYILTNIQRCLKLSS